MALTCYPAFPETFDEASGASPQGEACPDACCKTAPAQAAGGGDRRREDCACLRDFGVFGRCGACVATDTSVFEQDEA